MYFEGDLTGKYCTSSTQVLWLSFSAFSRLLQRGCERPHQTPGQQTQGLVATAQNHLAVTIGVAATAVLFLLLFVMVLYTPGGRKTGSSSMQVCETSACLMYAYYLKLSIDSKTDPCDDFYEYVCGSWKPPRRNQESVGQALFERIMSGVRSRAKNHPPSARTRATRKAANMFQACMNASSVDDLLGNVALLKAFLHRNGLHWPVHPDPSVHPLDVLVNLAARWRTEFVFRVSLHSSKGRLVVMFYPGKHLSDLAEVKVKREDFSYYVEEHAKLFTTSPFNKSEAEELLKTQQKVSNSVEALNVLLKNQSPGVRFPIRSVGGHSTVDNKTWISFLNKHLNRGDQEKEGDIDLDDLFFVTDIRLFHTLNRLLEIERGLLLSNIGWKLVERFGVVLSPAIAGIRNLPERDLGIYCCVLVEETFGLALTAHYTMDVDTHENRDLIENFLGDTSKAIAESVADSQWTEDSVLVARRKLTAMGWWVWVRGKTGYVSTLDRLYNTFPWMKGNFTGYWIGSNEALWQKSNTHDYLQYEVTSYPSRSTYLHYMNAAKIPSTFTFLPMFDSSSILAVNYAGLGALFSALISHAFDSVGIMFDNENNLRPWMSEASLAVYKNKLACYKDHANTPSMWASISLETTLKAYQKAEQSEETNPQILVNFTDYSSEKLFYMAYCFAECSRSGYDVYSVRNKIECNYALQQSMHFASTFRCPMGAKMNPEEKCSFWS